MHVGAFTVTPKILQQYRQQAQNQANAPGPQAYDSLPPRPSTAQSVQSDTVSSASLSSRAKAKLSSMWSRKSGLASSMGNSAVPSSSPENGGELPCIAEHKDPTLLELKCVLLVHSLGHILALLMFRDLVPPVTPIQLVGVRFALVPF
jgi:hypothetical protein